VAISSKPTGEKEPVKKHLDTSVAQLGLKHGDLLFLDYKEADQQMEEPPKEATTSSVNTSSAETTYNSVKQLPIDDQLDQADGKIYRPKDPKMCRHGDKGMCDYCMPLEPYDRGYKEEKSIKHLSFHAHLRELNASANKTGSASSYMAPLSEPDYMVAKKCPSGHPPWPAGICSKCQPSTITLQQQEFRMVDHVEFANPAIINTFIDAWRQTGTQRIGFLYGHYEPYEIVPLGIKAVVEAVYEPPQQDEADGVTLTTQETDKAVERAAELCGLTRVGVIFTDLLDAGAGDGSVVCKRHVDSYFLSSLELRFAAQLQVQHPTPCRWSDSGKFSSKFVTCVISGNKDGEIDISSYQASCSAEGMVKADLIEPSTNPSVMRVAQPTDSRYVPDIFYKRINEYKRAVMENAKPAFPLEYLLITLTHGFPDNPSPLFAAIPGTFPLANRAHVGQSQDLHAVAKHLGLKAGAENTQLSAISDFHLLVYIISLGILSPEEEELMARVALSKDVQDGVRLLESSGWQTLLTIVNEST
jgi:nuclear protein localization family protein 4